MYNPLVSIIIPVYCGENFMKKAIDSAINQTYKNIEIIVVNDGSPDNGKTREIALSYGDRIKYFEKENGGCASALNFGIKKMNGEWFSWLSHDDEYDENKVQKEIEIVNRYNLNKNNTIISCNAQIIDKDGRTFKHYFVKDCGLYSGKSFFHRLLFGQALNGCGLLIPKDVFEKIGYFSEKLIFLLDWEYWLRCAINGVELYRIGNENLVKNRIHFSQVTVLHKEKNYIEQKKLINFLSEKLVKENEVSLVKELAVYSLEKGFEESWIILKKYLKDKNINTEILYLKGIFKSVKSEFLEKLKNIYWKIRRR